jgi:hypothetical protein
MNCLTKWHLRLLDRRVWARGVTSTRLMALAAMVTCLVLPDSGRADADTTAELRGRVVYADGQPAAGALVDALYAMPQNRMSQSLREAYRTRTDEAGNYALTNLSRDLPIPEIVVSLVEYADRTGGISFTQHAGLTLDFELELQVAQQPQPGEAAKVAVHTPREPRHRTFSGRVARADGSVIEGALVTFGDWPGALNYSVTQTDFRGIYSLSAVTRRAVLAVQARGCAPAFKSVITRGDAEFDFVLKPGHWIEGRILDQRGKPVTDATVAARASTLFGDKRDLNSFWRYRLVNCRATSGPDGKFRLEDLPATGVLVDASASGLTPAQGRAMEVDQANTVITLLPIGRIVGRVVRLADDGPVADFTVSVVPEDQVPAGKAYQGGVPFWQQASKTFHSKDGQFSLEGQNAAQIVGVVVEAGGYRREGARLTVSPAETAEQNALTFRLSDQLTFTGRLTTPGDGLRSNLLVAVTDTRFKGGDFAFLSRPEADRTAVTARTDASGAFRLDGVRAHLGAVLIDKPGSWRSVVRDISLEEPFKPEAWVCGKLTREGKPLAHQRIDLETGRSVNGTTAPWSVDRIKAVCLTSPSGEYCLYLDRLGDQWTEARLVGYGSSLAIKLAPGESRYDLDVRQGKTVVTTPGK